MDRRALRQMQPMGGWTPAPCEKWEVELTEGAPAHGWIGRSGRLYWCGPVARVAAKEIIEQGRRGRSGHHQATSGHREQGDRHDQRR